MARRAALFQNVQKTRPNVFLVDAGNLFGVRSEAERRQTEFLCEETRKLGYEVFGVGSNDLNYGLEFLRGVEKKHGFVFTNANLRMAGQTKELFPPFVVREVGGIKVGYISVISPRYEIVTMTAKPDNFEVLSPREALEKHLPELREQAQLIVLLAQMPSQDVRQLLMDMGPGTGIDVCVEGRDARQYRRINKVNGDVILVAANNEGKYQGQLDLVVSPDGTVVDAAVTVHALDNASPQIDEIADRVNKFEVQNKEQASAVQGFTHTRGYGGANDRFLGVHTCARCHSEAARVYAQSAHAQAFQSLVTKGQDRNGECVGCHVVGFDHANGYDQVPDPNVPGREALKNVQCEACHGYGTEHDRNGNWLAQARASCTTCHDQANSPNFDYATYWEKIAH